MNEREREGERESSRVEYPQIHPHITDIGEPMY